MSGLFLDNPQWVFYLAVISIGFSTSATVTMLFSWAKPYFDNYDRQGKKKSNDPKLDRPFVERCVFALAALTSLLGATFATGAMHFVILLSSVPGYQVSELTGRAGETNYVHYLSLLGGALGAAFALGLRKRM